MFSSKTVYNSKCIDNLNVLNKCNAKASVSKCPTVSKDAPASSKLYADVVKNSPSKKSCFKSSESCSKSSESCSKSSESCSKSSAQGPAVSFDPSVSYKASNGPRSCPVLRVYRSAESRSPNVLPRQVTASENINNIVKKYPKPAESRSPDVLSRRTAVSEKIKNTVINNSKSSSYEETIVYDILDEKVSLPYIMVSTSHSKTPLRFLVDSGSSICLIRESSLTPKPNLENHIIKFKGINDVDTYAKTKGKFILSINLKENDNLPFYFHVIGNDINLPYDGIIGTSFMKAYKVNVLYSKSRLEISDDPNRYFNMIMTRPSYTVPARSEMFIECYVTNPEIKEGVILENTLPQYPDIYFAKCLVRVNSGNKILVSVLNTSEKQVKINNLALTIEPVLQILESKLDLDVDDNNLTLDPSKIPCVMTIESDRDYKVQQVLRCSHMNQEEETRLRDLCSKYSDIFYLEGDRLTCTNSIRHEIRTKVDTPVNVKSYRFPECHKEEVSRQVQEMLNQKIIRPSVSPWSAPIWVVPKKPDASGKVKWRIVIDYRKLNEITIGDAYPIPNINEILDQLGHSKYFTTLDLASSFHQVSVKDSDKTAFSVPSGHYEYCRMPFGLRNAPSTFQRLMNIVLTGLQGLHCYTYMDDIIIHSSQLDQHVESLELVFKRLREHNLKLQPDKSEFLRREVQYLGHIISDAGVKPDPSKIACVSKFPVPKSPKDIKSFLGLVGYYRRFIENFSHISKPLTSLLKKDVLFTWTPEQQKAFDLLKTKITTAPILQFPDFSKPFVLTTDASNYAISAILSQGEVGKDLPISFASRTLNKAEGNYSTTEKECLAIIFGTKTFRPYLFGHKFSILSDHKPLQWLFNCKDPGSKLVRWRLKLEEFDYEIKHKVGKLNSNADSLSRNPVLAVDDDLQNPIPPPQNARENPSPPLLDFPFSPMSLPSPSINPPFTPLNPPSPPFSLPSLPPTPLLPPSPSQNPSPSAMNPQSPSCSETYEKYLQLSRTSSCTYNAVIEEHNESLLKTKCKLIAYPTSIDLDDAIPYCPEIIELSTDKPCIRDKERELGTVLNSSNDKHIFSHLFVTVHHYDEISYKDIFSILRDYRDMIRFWYPEEKEVAISDFSNPFNKLNFTKIYNIVAFIFHDSNLKVHIHHNNIYFPTPDEVKKILRDNHDSPSAGHPGIARMLERIKSQYWWKNMRSDIENYVKGCKSCQVNKPLRGTNKAPMIITSNATRPMEKLYLDIVGPLPETRIDQYKFILTLQDDLTKYSQAYPMQSCSAQETAQRLVHFISHVGIPRTIVTDQGTNFCSDMFKQLARLFGIKHIFASPYHPQTCGALERSHSTLKEYLRSFISENQNTWDLYVNTAMLSYNTNVHSTTGFTPFELIFGFKPYVPKSIDILEGGTYTDYIRALNHRLYYSRQKASQNIQSSKERSKNYYDRHTKPVTYSIGDMVYVRCHHKQNKAFSPVWKGPFKIIKINGNHTVTVLINRRHVRHHYDEIKLAANCPSF